MKNDHLQQLLKSVQQAGAIQRGELNPERTFESQHTGRQTQATKATRRPTATEQKPTLP